MVYSQNHEVYSRKTMAEENNTCLNKFTSVLRDFHSLQNEIIAFKQENPLVSIKSRMTCRTTTWSLRLMAVVRQ
ncbi:hypothetical protein A6X21_13570 [Planctopirus hydrillae]|uniref:Uncharacterized protein n=1 Tax=Planctopirus hydrillae TaxID=1841610 RepID=A0A1C3E3V8_9PLAN|nr:hypothetical protein A6X21_13570 [Planctopirus hydrillae]